MPLNSAQLAELVTRARLKTPPAVSPPPPAQRPVRPRQATPAPKAPSPARPPAEPEKPAVVAAAATAVPAAPVSAPTAEQATATNDFPIGWLLSKESWHFHRRFHRIFRRPMRQGEYSQLLGQIRRRTGEHLAEGCWRVTLPGSTRTLSARAPRWRLITILPRNWQPPLPTHAA